MNLLFVFSFVLSISGITPLYLEDHIFDYFNSDVVKQATITWQKHMVAFESAISLALKENYGFKGMNVYIRRPVNPLFVGTGYYHTDNQVHLVLHNMNLEDYPHLSDPLVQLRLLSNVIKVEAIVSRMNIRANYFQFRNTSDIAYDLVDQDSYKMSPFLFPPVQNAGQLAITVEGCKLSGIGITSLTGRSISLGNTVFRLLNCRFNLEIFTPGLSTPPVIADYFPNGEGLNLENLIMKPLQAELVPKLQSLLQTYINTSSVFKESLGHIRAHQAQVFEQVTNYVNSVVRNLNVLTMTRNVAKVVMDDFQIRYNDTIDDGAVDSVLNLRNLILTGLETVYTSHTGGPFRLTNLKISEELRYGTLQVRGSIDVQSGENTKGMYDFAVELNDVAVDVTADLERNTENSTIPARFLHSLEVTGWRSAQYSCPGMPVPTGEALIIGYIQTKVPIYLANHLIHLLGQAVEDTDKEYNSLDKNTLGAPVPIEDLEIVQGDQRGPLNTNTENTFENDNINNGDENQDNLANNDENIPSGTIENNFGNGDTPEGFVASYSDDDLQPSVVGDGVMTPDEVEEENHQNQPSVVGDGFIAPDEVEDHQNLGGIVDPGLSEGRVVSDGQPLQPQIFDENMFAEAQNKGRSDHENNPNDYASNYYANGNNAEGPGVPLESTDDNQPSLDGVIAPDRAAEKANHLTLEGRINYGNLYDSQRRSQNKKKLK